MATCTPPGFCQTSLGRSILRSNCWHLAPQFAHAWGWPATGASLVAVPDQKMALVVPWSSRAVLLERSDATDPMASGSSAPGALPQPSKATEESVREMERRDSN